MGKKKALESPAQKTKIIIKGNSSTYYKGTVSVDYRPNRKHQLYKTHKTKAFYPIFNKDKKCYTPTFILRKEDVENDQELQKTHQKKIRQYVTEISEDQILFAKPRSKHKYCGVCKDHYQDYKQHIQSQDHKTCNKNSKFSKQINKLINNFMVNKLFIEENDYYQKLKSEESYWGATSNQTADKHYLNDKKVVVLLSDQ